MVVSQLWSTMGAVRHVGGMTRLTLLGRLGAHATVAIDINNIRMFFHREFEGIVHSPKS